MNARSALAAFVLAASAALSPAEPAGAKIVKFLNYEGCVELSNEAGSKAILCPVGGRVLSFTLGEADAMYLDPGEANYGEPGGPKSPSSAGRFDIGPEYMIRQHPALWHGVWKAEILGDRAARLVSPDDEATGVRLVREFRLDKDAAHLSCKQVIHNISGGPRRWCHWGRSFSPHGGIAVVPLTPEHRRFPSGYIMMEGRDLMHIAPQDPDIVRQGDYLAVLRPPKEPKLGFDSFAGWCAYLLPSDVAFVKRFAADPRWPYNEVAGLTLSIWYPRREVVPACEIEPIGPANAIAPGESAEFTEHWHLVPHAFPAKPEDVDCAAVAKAVDALAK
ncbi:MAG: hypothetical protein R3F11_32025 [Verrucomicrobiales bacterium]